MTYSRRAREQLAAPRPPELFLEDEISTALESKLEKVQRARQKARNERERMEYEREADDSEGLETPTTSETFKPQV